MYHNPTDEESLKKYINDIRDTAPYSIKEEQKLFMLKKQGSLEARAKLIDANMRFVLKVAFQYRGVNVPLPDLISEGAYGLTRAVDKFDPTRGLKFISYAVWWIKAYITRAINDTSYLIRIPANQSVKFRKLLKEQPDGTTLDDDIKRIMRTSKIYSLDEKARQDTDSTFHDIIGKSYSPDTERREVEIIVREMLAGLSEREARILKSYYEDEQTLREVAESEEISNERVRQIKDQALKKLHRRSKKRFNGEKREILKQAIEVGEYSSLETV